MAGEEAKGSYEEQGVTEANLSLAATRSGGAALLRAVEWLECHKSRSQSLTPELLALCDGKGSFDQAIESMGD